MGGIAATFTDACFLKMILALRRGQDHLATYRLSETLRSNPVVGASGLVIHLPS